MTNKVWYVGSADSRTISGADFTSVGVTGQSSLTWDSTNAWGIDPTSFASGALAFLLTLAEFTQAATDPFLSRRPGGNESGSATPLTKAQADALYAPIGVGTSFVFPTRLDGGAAGTF
jgi:hypothetical protein